MSSVLLYQPLGLGDHIICNAIVREYAKRYERVGLFCAPHLRSSIAFMYRDLPNVRLHTINSHNDVSRYRLLNYLSLAEVTYEHIQTLGVSDPESGIMFEKQLYNSAKLPVEVKWDAFHIERDPKREEALKKKIGITSPFIFVHDDARFPTKDLPTHLPIVRPDPAYTDVIFDYCGLLEEASELHVIDSSFMFLADCLSYKNPTQKLVIHRYTRSNPPWNLPLLKKHWNILV